MGEKKPKLPSLAKVKKTLYDNWALRVKQRDGWKCLLCGGDALLTAHHWYFTSQRGHAARYCLDNGATLCFTCHIREVHENPGYATINAVRKAVLTRSPSFDEANIEHLAAVEVTTAALRKMWDAMRARPIDLAKHDILIDVKGSKLFMTVANDRQIAVAGNTVLAPGFGLCEVTVVSPFDGSYRYTLKRIPDSTTAPTRGAD